MNTKVWDALFDVLLILILLGVIRIAFVLYTGDW